MRSQWTSIDDLRECADPQNASRPQWTFDGHGGLTVAGMGDMVEGVKVDAAANIRGVDSAPFTDEALVTDQAGLLTCARCSEPLLEYHPSCEMLLCSHITTLVSQMGDVPLVLPWQNPSPRATANARSEVWVPMFLSVDHPLREMPFSIPVIVGEEADAAGMRQVSYATFGPRIGLISPYEGRARIREMIFDSLDWKVGLAACQSAYHDKRMDGAYGRGARRPRLVENYYRLVQGSCLRCLENEGQLGVDV